LRGNAGKRHAASAKEFIHNEEIQVVMLLQALVASIRATCPSSSLKAAFTHNLSTMPYDCIDSFPIALFLDTAKELIYTEMYSNF